jgi:hypothetical protein
MTKEHNFLKEICLTALSVDKSIKFAAVVDNKGKLLAGEYNSMLQVQITTYLILDIKSCRI